VKASRNRVNRLCTVALIWSVHSRYWVPGPRNRSIHTTPVASCHSVFGSTGDRSVFGPSFGGQVAIKSVAAQHGNEQD
jgi:hypothetical protein